MVKICEVTTTKERRAFVNLGWQLYRDDPFWVPPLKYNLHKILQGVNNPLFNSGPHRLFLAWSEGKPVGRVLVGINQRLNQKKNKKEGYISLFETIQNKEAAFSLLDHSCKWLKSNGMESVVGPISPTNGDDSRGLLIEGFNGPPVLMNSYNPVFYPSYFEDYGFQKDMDLYAYHFDPSNVPEQRFRRIVEYAMKKFNFHIDPLRPDIIEKEIQDVGIILNTAMPNTWEHLAPPSLDDIRSVFSSLKSFIDPDLIYIARTGDVPIGFVAALPDYNQVLKRLNGRLLPFGILKFLWYKRKINGCRIFIQFVVPKFQNKAVNGAIFHRLMLEGKKRGYVYGEGSTIAEMNTESIRSVEGAGGHRYRVYRIYRKSI